MRTWMRGVLWLVWLAGVGLLWEMDAIGAGGALVAGGLGLAMVVWPWTARRRRSALRYVEMGKQPVGLL